LTCFRKQIASETRAYPALTFNMDNPAGFAGSRFHVPPARLTAPSIAGASGPFPVVIVNPSPKNMREALERTYNATPSPKQVVAVGDCASDGLCLPCSSGNARLRAR
jgi:hypothetical protein